MSENNPDHYVDTKDNAAASLHYALCQLAGNGMIQWGDDDFAKRFNAFGENQNSWHFASSSTENSLRVAFDGLGEMEILVGIAHYRHAFDNGIFHSTKKKKRNPIQSLKDSASETIAALKN